MTENLPLWDGLHHIEFPTRVLFNINTQCWEISRAIRSLESVKSIPIITKVLLSLNGSVQDINKTRQFAQITFHICHDEHPISLNGTRKNLDDLL